MSIPQALSCLCASFARAPLAEVTSNTGGVGPMTIAMLMQNTLTAAKAKVK